MARRAGLYESLKQSQGKTTLFLAGPYEFLPDFGEEPPAPEAMPALAKAFELLGYNAGYLSKAEAEKFGPKLGPAWQVVDKDVVSQVVEISGNKIGIIYFPAIKKEEKAPSDDLRARIAREASKLRPQVKLVIGVSPWGAMSEGEYLSSKPPVDVLCGAGPGSGFNFRPDIDGKVLWGRSYVRGRAVNSLEILAWPGDKGFTWKESENFNASVLALDEKTPEDIRFVELFKDFKQEKDEPAGSKKPVK